MPTEHPEQGKLIYDVESSVTASEKRAPYGDSLKINRFERPFFQDMTYIPDMDIVTYNVSQDETWTYVSIELVGSNPNNPLGIYYGIELDLDIDGFGNYIIWAHPPYEPDWTTDGVRVFADTNHDTGGLSSQKSDIHFDGDGYETLIFDAGIGDDPDLAWVRASDERMATIQFAFKTSLAGTKFMLGVLADAGIKDVTKLDYNDRFIEEQAGSPEKSEKYYPLNALFAVDNACRTAIGFDAMGNEPQGCPRDEPLPKRRESLCQAPSGCTNWDPIGCECNGG